MASHQILVLAFLVVCVGVICATYVDSKDLEDTNNDPFHGRTKRDFISLFKENLKDLVHVGTRRLNPLHKDFNPGGLFDCKEKCGFIFLHGFGPAVPGGFTKVMAKSRLAGFGIRRNCIIKAPKAPKRGATLALPTKILSMLDINVPFVRSWFDFWLPPGASVVSPVAGEKKDDLEVSLGWVEDEIQALINDGVPSENIVVMGLSQGGAMTIYTALHSKYKLGGFIPMVTWLPLRKVEPITELPTPVNQDTPILHLNGLADPIVPYIPAGKKTEEDMKQVFTKYELKGIAGSHLTSLHPASTAVIRNWLRDNTNISSDTKC